MADAPTERIVINGVEYDPADAQSLIEAGSKARDFEKQWNTSLDRVYPEYTKATQRAAKADDLERELADLKAKATESERSRQFSETPSEQKRALQAARELGLADQEYLKEHGYVTADQLNKILDERRQQDTLVQTVLTTADKLERDIDGTDGRVPFNKRAVLAYASAYGLSDLQQAYDEINEQANKGWKKTQIESTRKPGLTTLRAQGFKTPDPKEVTKDNFSDVLKETLWGGSEE